MTPTQVHQRNVDAGLAADPAQFAVAAELTTLQQRLIANALARSAKKGLRLPRLLKRSRTVEPPHGLYLWGGVGRGKTYLMDVFYETLPKEAVPEIASVRDITDHAEGTNPYYQTTQ